MSRPTRRFDGKLQPPPATCRCFMLLTSTASFLVPLWIWLSSSKQCEQQQPISDTPLLQFELRQVHAVSSDSAHVIFSDVSPRALNTLHAADDPTASTKAVYGVRSRMATVYRPSSPAAHAQARLRSLRFGENERLDWFPDEIEGPDVEARETLLELAKMTNNAYVEPDDPAWYDLEGRWNVVRALSPRDACRWLTFCPVVPVWVGS